MSIVNAFPAALSLVLAMNIASADISMSQADCASIDYAKAVTAYETQMKDAARTGDTPLYRQAKQNWEVSKDNAKACTAFEKAQQLSSASSVSQ